MSVSASKTPLFTSGPIKFSDLRNNFKGTTDGSVSAAELLRNVNVSEKNPIVPDATENAAVATSTNLSTSQFRTTIKSYAVTQSGTDAALDLSANTVGGIWNGNLNKNIRKNLEITGECSSSNEASGASALRLANTIYNLDLNVNPTGRILGASGDGGTAASPRGNRGGTAIIISNPNGSAVNVRVLSGGIIYAGGSGGSKGATGATGAPGTCYYYTYYTVSRCGSCPGCGSDTQISCRITSRCRWSRNRQSTCRRTNSYSVPGAPGGVGGDGAPGRGFDYSGSLTGATGALGTPGGCPDPNSAAAITSRLGYGGSGQNGEKGGDGGEWGARGAATILVPTGGGDQGNAIEGSGYQVDSSSDASGIKGDR